MFKKILSAGLLSLAALGSAHADGPVRLIIAFPPGGPVDLVGRVLAEQLGKELKQQVIVENKAGANGNIAAAYVAKAPPGAVQGPAV
jgi:tripartite-type tricarboxylate transporter receptor subunit TctC